ncbi:MAG: hypothetical protein H6R01_906 [Burkholderiaceae bacterium]|nr:hypothetical protein [Burkholderiaceae bacterium]
MLIRIRGGRDGIKNYLVNGKKAGRNFSRDELDERVILAGDLDLTDTIIQSMSTQGERYLHVTFSFREDNVAKEILQSCVDDFAQFAFAAYTPEEYNFYAEAHLPKISSYLNESDGKNVVRKPHIHIVIPETNLLSCQRLNPFGYVANQEQYLQALQEVLNAKYGLASPQDYPRTKSFTDESSIISLHQGDVFKGANQNTKRTLLKRMLEARIDTHDKFTELLATLGECKTVNSNRFGEYINFKPSGSAKGINLREYAFSRKFIEKPFQEKIKILTADLNAEIAYEDSGATRDPKPQHVELLDEWHQIRSAEVKYINSGNRKLYEAYRFASRETQLSMLSEMATGFYQKHQQQYEVDGAEVTPQIITTAAQANDKVEPGRPLRRASDCVVGQLVYELDTATAEAKASSENDIATIKQNLDAERLLAYLSHTHGEMPEKYSISKGKDGSDRIQCGSRKWNVSDFLTKERHLTWAEAESILRTVYAAQLNDKQIQKRSLPGKELWLTYRNEWRPQHQARRQAAWQMQRGNERSRRNALKEKYRNERNQVYQSHTNKSQRKAALSLLLVEKIIREEELRAQIASERNSLKALFVKPSTEHYRSFLVDMAQKGNSQALAELRRQVVYKDEADSRSVITSQADDKSAPLMHPMRFSVSRNGHVTYVDDQGYRLFADSWRSVQVYQEDEKTIETCLRLAQQKFGNVLTLNGSDEFKRRTVEIAVHAGMRVEFGDKKLNEYAQELAGSRNRDAKGVSAEQALERFRENWAEDVTADQAKAAKPKFK